MSVESHDPAELLAADEPSTGDLIAAWNHRPSWMARAACRGERIDVFFPTLGHDSRPARAVCDACPVLPACLRFALDDETLTGVWGGTDDRERARIRRQSA